jgi:hypothetical protein
MPGPHVQLDSASVTRMISELEAESPVSLTDLVCKLCKIHRYSLMAGQTRAMHSTHASLLVALEQLNTRWQSITPEVEKLLGDLPSMTKGDVHKFIQRCVPVTHASAIFSDFLPFAPSVQCTVHPRCEPGVEKVNRRLTFRLVDSQSGILQVSYRRNGKG